MDRLRFQSFGSGSSGNCYFIGNSCRGILIDAGIGVRTIRRNLKNLGLDFEHIWGVFVTHDHADHIKAVGPVGEKHHVPIYTTKTIHEGIHKSYCVTEKLYSSKKYIEKGETVKVGDFTVTAFHVSHDATDCVGYTVEYQEKRFTFATDLGYVNEEVKAHAEMADYLLIESNYDEQMLRQGPYPVQLQERIIADTGHLSNDQCGKFLSGHYNKRTKHIFLCHLSRENNHPDIAYTTVQNYLEEGNVRVGEDVRLVTLERTEPSELFVF